MSGFMRIKKHVIALSLLGAIFLLPFPGYTQSPSFLPELEDIPLMPGLTVAPQGEVFFPTVVGRIATIKTISHLDWRLVVDFYQKTLPSLGWTILSPTLYTRDNEQLEISSQNDSQGSYVVFSVSPVAGQIQ